MFQSITHKTKSYLSFYLYNFLQIAAKPWGDNLTLTIAEEIERAFGGWIEPKLD